MQTEISLQDLATIVKQMRRAQIDFFRFGRNKSDLQKSIKLESKVDEILKKIPTTENTNIPFQSNLF